MTMLAYLLASALFLWPVLANAATTYYVATGGSGTCKTTIGSPGAGINANLGCLGPGDTLYVRGGTYTERLHAGLGTSWPSGNPGNYITVAGYPGETVTIRPPYGPSVDLVNFQHVGYLALNNFTLDAQEQGYTYVVRLDTETHHLRISNNKIIGTMLGDYGFQIGTTGVQVGGFPSEGPADRAGYEILNNEIYNNGSYGIYVITNDMRIDGNYVHDNGAYGLHLYWNEHSVSVDVVNVVVRNNVVANNGGSSPVSGGNGMVIASSTGTKIYNNIFLNQRTPGGAGIQVYPRNVGAEIYNNTVVGNATQCIVIDGVNTVVKNNICYGNGQDITNSDGGAIISSNNPNSRNPRFVDPPNGNYRLQTTSPRSDALDAAENLSGIFTGDITGTVTRPATGNWDQGAYEMEAGGGGGLIPEKGTFFIDDTGTNTTDCHAATGTVGSPSASPFGDYATARICMQPGSTLYFRTGTYPPLDSGSTPFAGGSPADGPTTLAAYPSETVTLQATGGSPVVFLRNSMTDHFIILQGLILDGLNITGTNGFAGYPGINDIRLDNVEVKNTYYEGVYLEQTSNVELRNTTRVHNSAVATVGVIGLNRTTNTTITGSEVYASGGPGISSYGGNTNLLIEKSTIRNTPSGKGIILGNASTPDSGVRIANNLIYTNTHGIHLQNGTSNVGLYYNTLWNNSTACMLFDSGVTVSEAINNVCWQVATVTNNAGSGMALTTNQCTGPTGCTAGDPLFASVTPGDANFLHLCGAAGAPVVGCTGKSPAVDTGTPIPSLTSDYASKARPDGVQVDRGAFEEVPVPVSPAQVGLAPVYRTTHFLTLLP